MAELDLELGMPFIEKALEVSESARLLSAALEREGLRAMPERARVVSVYSSDSRVAMAIGILPFVSDDLSRHAGLSVSQGGYATAVRVDMRGRTSIGELHTMFVSGGDVRVYDFQPEELYREGAKSIGERVPKVQVEQPLADLSVRQVRSISSFAHSALLHDDSSMGIYASDELAALRGNGPLAIEIGTLALMQTASSPGGCSCSSSCWGCSSCSCSWG